jgi:cell division protein FtsN
MWVLTTWLPRGVPATVASARADSAATEGGAEGPLYVQVSTSQNPEWSQHLADDLSRAGMSARVLPPQSADDGYRVVLGPFPSRAQAEATGRRLGRPFWIYQPGQ